MQKNERREKSGNKDTNKRELYEGWKSKFQKIPDQE